MGPNLTVSTYVPCYMEWSIMTLVFGYALLHPDGAKYRISSCGGQILISFHLWYIKHTHVAKILETDDSDIANNLYSSKFTSWLHQCQKKLGRYI